MLLSDNIKTGDQFLSAKQAAARLGIKVETLYAYVSRGLVERQKDAGAHESRFSTADIESLRVKRNFGKGAGGLNLTLRSGATSIVDGDLMYRGESAVQLASSTTFESVAELLWSVTTDRFNDWRFTEIEASLAVRAEAFLPASSAPLERLQALFLVLSAFDRDASSFHPELVASKARSVISLASHFIIRHPDKSIIDFYKFNNTKQIISDIIIDKIGNTEEIPNIKSIINTILVLSIDHDFTAPTLSVRIAASQRTSLYSSLMAGAASLNQALHLKGIDSVIQLFEYARETKPSVDKIAAGLSRLEVRQAFGHRLYPTGDPRAKAILKQMLPSLANPQKSAAVACVINAARTSKLQPPNLGFALAAFSYLGDLSDGLAPALFALARIVGWVTHYIEEHSEPPGRFAAQSHYVKAETHHQ